MNFAIGQNSLPILLTEKEVELLTDVRKRVLEVISVDDFDLAELQAGLGDTGEAVRDQGEKKAA